jgi:ABC-type nitrate/sulfonate/bicarbonate transport system permease component
MKTETIKTETTPLTQPHLKTKAVARPQQNFFQRNEGLILGGGAVLIAIGIWQAIWSFTDWISPLFFSGPTAIAKAFWISLTQGNLLADLAFSGKNFVLGFGLALVTGVVFGVVIGWYRRVRLVFDPFVNALYAAPRIALMPIIIMWFGIDYKSKVFIVFLSAFFPILVNTVAGIRNMDRDLLRAARAFCASDWQIFKTLAIPGSVPFILTGVRQGVAVGLIGVVVGEMLGSSEGIGFMVAYGGQTFQTDTLFVGFVIIALAGILLSSIAERLERRFSRWRPER